MSSFCQILLTELLVLGLLLSVSSAQNFHFSNGWQPGKRSQTTDTCSFRPHIKLLLSRIIEVMIYNKMFFKVQIVCFPTFCQYRNIILNKSGKN